MQLRQTALAGLDRRAFQQCDDDHHFLSAQVKPLAGAMLDGSRTVVEHLQFDGQQFAGSQIAGRGDFVSAHDFAVMHARQIDRRPLSGLDEIGFLPVVLQATHEEFFARGMPLDFVADTQLTRPDSSRDDRAEPLHAEGAIDRQAKDVAPRLPDHLPAHRTDRIAQTVDSLRWTIGA